MPNITQDDIMHLVAGFYPAAGIRERRADIRSLIREAIQLAQELDTPGEVDSISPTTDPTIACLARFAECWDLFDRSDFEDHDQDAEEWPPIPATVVERGAASVEGIPNYWIRVSGEYASAFPAEAEDGIEVLLRIGDEQFDADLRFVKANNYLQIYPRLRGSDGESRLGGVLAAAGYGDDDLIELYVVKNVIRVRQTPPN